MSIRSLAKPAGGARFIKRQEIPDNFGYFGDFLSRFREFDRQGDAGEDFA
jgi:hypothetical protein